MNVRDYNMQLLLLIVLIPHVYTLKTIIDFIEQTVNSQRNILDDCSLLSILRINK